MTNSEQTIIEVFSIELDEEPWSGNVIYTINDIDKQIFRQHWFAQCIPSRGNELTGYNVTEEFEQLEKVEEECCIND